MVTTSLGQVVGKKITTTLYSSVVNPVLQIGRGRGGGGGHPDPEIRTGDSPKKVFLGLFGPQFGLKISALPWILHCS